MEDKWFIFDTIGNFLFKTTNENRANINKIPTNFNAKYIIKNPTGYDENKEQHISYNISSNSVIFSEISSFENIINEEIVDYKELFTELKNALDEIDSLKNTISILSDRLNSNVSTLNGRIDITNGNVDTLSDRSDNITNIINSVFTNVE
jgi:methyl-accepting chemotaxis protein